jgi:hypothetical protein
MVPEGVETYAKKARIKTVFLKQKQSYSGNIAPGGFEPPSPGFFSHRESRRTQVKPASNAFSLEVLDFVNPKPGILGH